MAQRVKDPPAVHETWFDPCVGKVAWRREWLPTSVSLPGEFHGWRSRAGYTSVGSLRRNWATNTHRTESPSGYLKLTKHPKPTMRAKSVQPCRALRGPTEHSRPGSSVGGILQTRVLDWLAAPSSGAPSPPRDQTHLSSVFCTSRRVLYL